MGSRNATRLCTGWIRAGNGPSKTSAGWPPNGPVHATDCRWIRRWPMSWCGSPATRRVICLRPRYAVVPFVDRENLLAQLMLWRETDVPLAVAVLAGAGGAGKTRTASEVCGQAQRAGWTVGRLADTPGEVDREGLTALAAWPSRLLVACTGPFGGQPVVVFDGPFPTPIRPVKSGVAFGEPVDLAEEPG